jgi:riboflavin transporter FmnP
MLYTLRFFISSKWSLFHNAKLFGSCIIHILYRGCAKIKKNNSGAKGLTAATVGISAAKHNIICMILNYTYFFPIMSLAVKEYNNRQLHVFQSTMSVTCTTTSPLIFN